MSLTGALLAGVSGLQAQSNAMGIISNNIANLNTIGYKTAAPTFETLVVNSLSASYSPGGVQAGSFTDVGAQGTLQASNSPLDVAITGNGFFPVTDATSGGQALYTRAGSFHQNSQGNLVNSAGLYLEGWALTQSGQIANVNQLQVISVGTNNGVAVGTQNVTVGANLDSSQLIDGNKATSAIAAAFSGLTSTSNLGQVITATVGSASTTNATDLGTAVSAGGLGLDTTSTVTVTVPGVGSQTFTYVAGGGNGTTTFTSLSDLETDINAFAGAGTAADNGASPPVLTITAPAAGINITTAGTDATSLFGSTGVAALGLANGDDFTVTVNGTPTTLTYTTSSSPGANQFHTLADLASDLDALPGVQASLTGSGPPTLTVTSPDAVTMTDVTGTPVASLFGTSPTTIAATYAVGDMQDGTVTPQFTDQIQVFDSLGTTHTVDLAFVHTGTNQWAYELYDSDSDIAGVATGRGLLSAGTITFNGDGSLNSITATPATLPSGITNQPLYTGTPPTAAPIDIAWSNGASSSAIAFNLGTAGALGTGKTDGITQFASAFNNNFTNQDGAAVGLQTGVSIDQNGFVIASYSNGATQKLFQVPITTFPDPSQLQAQDGNAYSQTVASGNFNWRIAGSGGAGTIATSSLEESTADLGDQFALMITTQTAYEANSKTITTANDMLQTLLQVIQS